jgi:hypothetical protein
LNPNTLDYWRSRLRTARNHRLIAAASHAKGTSQLANAVMALIRKMADRKMGWRQDGAVKIISWPAS